MRVRAIFVHNRYQYRGGENAVVEAEIALLRSHGHEVGKPVPDRRFCLLRRRSRGSSR